MRRTSAFYFLVFTSFSVFGGPILQMNRAFSVLSELIPYLTDSAKFMDKNNSIFIEKKMAELQSAFKDAKHDPIIKEDLFAPSYALVYENIVDSQKAFKSGKKDYAYWRIKEITSHCIDCHSRMPESFASSFQNGEQTIDQSKFSDPYNLGLAQLIVRRYADAKASFIKDIDEKLIKKSVENLELPFKQLLLVETKVQKNPLNMIATIDGYSQKRDLPEGLKITLKKWKKKLTYWSDSKRLKTISNDKELDGFISRELLPLKKQGLLEDGSDVDLLMASGQLSHYLFQNPSSKMVPEITFWLGWTEKYLKREKFFGSGNLFLKQCIHRYPKNPVAQLCLDEYRESVEFDFSGSAGTDIPDEIKEELKGLKNLIRKK